MAVDFAEVAVGGGPSFATGFEPPVDPHTGECAAARDRVLGEIERLGLERNATELEWNGFTVLLPEQVGPPEFHHALRDDIARLSEKRTGRSVELDDGQSHAGLQSPFGSVQMDMGALLLESELIEKAIMNETVLAVITYLLGESCLLSHLGSLIKGPGTEYMPLHADQNVIGAPAPWPLFAQQANATWCLTDYSEENGSTVFVAGSHKLCRPPTYEEATNLALFEPVECPEGSVLIWHGNTWHGSVPRRTQGVRVNLTTYFTRWYSVQAEPLAPRITREMLARNPERFAVLTGVSKPYADPSTPTGQAVRYSLYA
jgi:hypothetical protein